jgi:hypothetical protein
MKRLLIITLLVFITSFIKGQTAYLTLSPVDMGVGVRIDTYYGLNGVYISAAKGSYLFYGGHIDNHLKTAVGCLFHLPGLYDDVFLSSGICFHNYGDSSFFTDFDTTVILAPISYEVGGGMQFKRISVALRFDIYKWESSIDIGFKF